MDPRRKKVIIDQRFTPPITVPQDEYQVVDPDNLFGLPSDDDNPDEETDPTPHKKHHHKHKNHHHHHRHPRHHHHNHHKHHHKHHFGGKQSLGGGSSHHHHHKKNDHPVNRQDGKGKLSPPTNLVIISQDVHQGAAKQQVIDITVKFDNVPNATKYNARVSKV